MPKEPKPYVICKACSHEYQEHNVRRLRSNAKLCGKDAIPYGDEVWTKCHCYGFLKRSWRDRLREIFRGYNDTSPPTS